MKKKPKTPRAVSNVRPKQTPHPWNPNMRNVATLSTPEAMAPSHVQQVANARAHAPDSMEARLADWQQSGGRSGSSRRGCGNDRDNNRGGRGQRRNQPNSTPGRGRGGNTSNCGGNPTKTTGIFVGAEPTN